MTSPSFASSTVMAHMTMFPEGNGIDTAFLSHRVQNATRHRDIADALKSEGDHGAAQRLDLCQCPVDIDHVRGRIKCKVRHILDDHGARDRRPVLRMRYSRRANSLLVSSILRLARSTRCCTRSSFTRRELAVGKWLRQIVMRTRIQALHAIFNRRALR